MALPHQTQSVLLLALSLSLFLQSCSHGTKQFKSNCDADKEFVHISFKQLMDSLPDYDQQYVEVSGKYEEDKEVSALICDSLLADHSSKNALWVNFSQDCPLYLTGTHEGLFEYTDNGFTQLKDKAITIRGMVDMRNKGHLKQYKATIDRVSLVKY